MKLVLNFELQLFISKIFKIIIILINIFQKCYIFLCSLFETQYNLYSNNIIFCFKYYYYHILFVVTENCFNIYIYKPYIYILIGILYIYINCILFFFNFIQKYEFKKLLIYKLLFLTFSLILIFLVNNIELYNFYYHNELYIKNYFEQTKNFVYDTINCLNQINLNSFKILKKNYLQIFFFKIFLIVSLIFLYYHFFYINNHIYKDSLKTFKFRNVLNVSIKKLNKNKIFLILIVIIPLYFFRLEKTSILETGFIQEIFYLLII